MLCRYDNLLRNIKDLSDNLFGKYLTSLDHKYDERTKKIKGGGLCFGLACMWGQAVLAQDEKTYYNRLNILTKSYPEKNSLSAQVYSAMSNLSSKKNLQKRNDKNRLLLSIRPFLDGLLLYHNPRRTSLYKDKVNRDLCRQNVQLSSKYVTNASITKKRDKAYF
ncbi:MAG: hypothetical protein GY710_21395 [Desulfobacteraceae bacterium]|nr:hypothetical protein [Desulfobacteraceae bacterium]